MTARPEKLTATTLFAAAVLAAVFPTAACRRRAPPGDATDVPAPTRPAPARAEASGYPLRPAEKRSVDRFLEKNPELRPATDEDRRRGGDESLRELYGVYHPYFVRGDANDDGTLDFVLAFVRRDSDPEAPWFTVVVFSGREDGSFEAGIPVERDISLADGDLSIDRDAILVTPDTTEDAARRYRWDPARRRHVFVRDEPEEAVSPPPART
jgi:hypothetical protein